MNIYRYSFFSIRKKYIWLVTFRLFGNYESLVAGRPRDALVDITGGVGELLSLDTYKTEKQRMELFDILHESIEQRSLMSASIAVCVQ